MDAPSLILFDDDAAAAWEPFALTRPAGELLFGALTLRERAERVLGLACSLYVGAPHLRGFDEQGVPPVVDPADAPAEGDRLFLLSRVVPDWDARLPEAGALREGPLTVGGQTAGWFSPAGAPAPPPAFFSDPAAHEVRGATELPGHMLQRVWELVSGNEAQLARDIPALFPDAAPPELPPGVLHWGEHPLVLGEGVRLEPGCALNTSDGPIWIDRGVTVQAFTRLAGPAYVGRDSTLLGGSIESVSIGPVCKVRGELSASVCLGYTNKQHDGHMGHAYLGRWVNLGAETTNSDLKNNYGTIRMWTPDGPTDSGEMKMGSLVGDHVKTGIGLLLNTGTVIGAGSNLYGAAMPPTFVPPFSWGTGDALMEYRLDKFLEVTERAMSRRDVPLSDRHRSQLEAAWERGRNLWGTDPEGEG